MTKEFKVRNVSGNSDLEVEYHNKHTVAKIVAAVVAAFIVLVVVIAAVSGGGDDGKKTEAPGVVQETGPNGKDGTGEVEDPSHPERKGDPTPKTEKPKKTEAQIEAEDVKSISLDNRSEAGFDDVYVKYTVKNQSAKTSDYEITYDVEMPDGTRVYNSFFYVTNLSPGKTDVGEDTTILTDADVKGGAKITNVEVERTEAVG